MKMGPTPSLARVRSLSLSLSSSPRRRHDSRWAPVAITRGFSRKLLNGIRENAMERESEFRKSVTHDLSDSFVHLHYLNN